MARGNIFPENPTKAQIIRIFQVYKAEDTTVGIRCADHATPSIRKSWH
jgi:hypothetical protein